MTQLKQTIKGVDLLALAVGTIVGVGWLVVVGSWLTDAGPLGALIGLGIGAVLVCTIGRAYAEVFSTLPSAGGEVVVAFEAFGPGLGFATGWILVYVYFCVSAFEAISLGWLSTVLAPGLAALGSYEFLGGDVQIGALLVGLVGTIVVGVANYRGAVVAAALQKALLLAMLILTLIFLGFALSSGSVGNLSPWLAGQSLVDKGRATLAILATAPFWFAGFNVLPQALGERHKTFQLHRMGALIVASIVVAFAFYCAVIIATGMALPRSEIAQLDLPAAAAFEVAFQSKTLSTVVLLVGLLGLATTWNAVVFAGARVVYCMATAGALPAWLSSVHPRNGTPGAAIAAISILSAVITLLGRDALASIVNAVGFCFALMYLLVALALPRLRAAGRVSTSGQRGYRMPGGRPMVVLTIMLAVSLVAISGGQLFIYIASGALWQAAVLAGWAVAGFAAWIACRQGAWAETYRRQLGA